jgi:FKBP-type peptidyl-prolyl cis-trans isomerase FkpA
MSIKHFGGAVLVVALLASCGKDRVKVTENGLKYSFQQENASARKPKVGDVLTYHITVRNSKDSLLGSSHQQGQPVKQILQVPAFKGAIEEGLALMHKGDSATFYVSADSLIGRSGQPYPAFIAKGSDLSYGVRLVDVLSEEEFQKAEAKTREGQKSIDDKIITDYLAKNGLTGKAQKSASGVYVLVTKAGAGAMPQKGETVEVHYTGKTLAGKVFDSSKTNPQSGGKPVSFPIGVGMVIPGWEEGVMKMHKGESATLIIPSTLAYGAQGNQGIKPNEVLLFDIDLINITKTPPQQQGGMPGQPQQQPGR